MIVAVVVFVLSLFAPCLITVAAADDAAVLPKGRFSFGAENRFYFPADERFGPNRKAEDLVGAFNNRALNASVFPNLAGLSPFVVGSPSIGDAFVHFEYHYDILAFGLA